jgi:MFS family permease
LVHFRLSLMMFLMFAVVGSWLPLLTIHLDELGFNPQQIALASSTAAMAYLAASLVAGQFADRWIAAERCIAVGSLIAGALLVVLARLEEPAAFTWTCFAFWMVMVPVLTLGNALTFSHLRDAARHFGQIRLWGTVGWVASAWLVGGWLRLGQQEWWRDHFPSFGSPGPALPLDSIFYIGAGFCFILAVYALTLPHTPPKRRALGGLAPLQALGLLRHRDFAVYFFGSLVLYTTIPFSGQVAPLLLKSLGIPDQNLGPLMTISQSTEVLMLALLPTLSAKLGFRGTMLLGLTVWTVGLWILAWGQPTWLVAAATAGSGVLVACFMVTGQVFVDRRAPGHIRASAQSLLGFGYGFGLLAGHLMAGQVRTWTAPEFRPTFVTAAATALAVLLFFLAGFRRRSAYEEKGERLQ